MVIPSLGGLPQDDALCLFWPLQVRSLGFGVSSLDLLSCCVLDMSSFCIWSFFSILATSLWTWFSTYGLIVNFYLGPTRVSFSVCGSLLFGEGPNSVFRFTRAFRVCMPFWKLEID